MSGDIVLLGAGGHARVLADALAAMGMPAGAVVSPEPPAGPLAGLRWLGGDEALLGEDPLRWRLVNAVGSVGDTGARRALFERFHGAGFRFATVIHPSAILAADVSVGEGAQVMAGAVIQPGCRIGANAVINTRACIDHDGMVGAHAFIAPGAVLSGGVGVGEGAHVGPGAVVVQGIRIGAGALVAAGAAVVADVAAGTTVMGVPARPRGEGRPA